MRTEGVRTDLALATSSQLTQKLVGYALLVVLARYLDKASMGEFFYATTLATVVAMFTELGTTRYLLRGVAEEPETAADRLSEVLSLRLPLTTAAFALLNAGVAIVQPDLQRLVLLVSAFVLLGDLYYSFGVTLLGLQRVGSRVVVDLIGQSALLGFVLGAVWMEASLTVILLAYLAANVVLVAAAVWMVRTRTGRLSLALDVGSSLELVRDALPFFVLALLGVLHFKIDTMMLFALASPRAVADYEAGYKLLEVSRVAVRPAAMIFFPICAALAVKGRWPEFRRLYRRLTLGAAGLGILAAAVVGAGAGVVVPFVWGARYADTVPLLRVLYLTVPAVYVGFVATFLAGALHLERAAAWGMAAAVALNVALNAAAIPLWGAMGAAWTTLVSHSLVGVWLAALVARKVRSESTLALGVA